MFRRAGFIVALAFLSGCKTLAIPDIGIGDGASTTTIVTDPPGALVRVEGYGECTSPCTVRLDAPRQITIAKAGFNAQHFELKPGKRTVRVKLDLVAPTKGIESTTLPPVH